MRHNDGWIGGLILIAIGTALLLGQLSDEVGRFVLLGIGVTLLIIWVFSRNPGALIGGGIVTGLGAGVAVASYGSGDLAGAAVLFGLGGGFVFVGLMGELFRLPPARGWPFIPGVILILVGGIVLAGAEGSEAFALLWPVILIGIGAILVVAAFVRRSGPDEPVPPPPTTQP